VHSGVHVLYEKRLAESKFEGFEPDQPKPSECADLILTALEDNPATIIIDAFDEIEDPKRLVDFLETLIKQSRNVVNVFITSRDDPTILSTLSAHQNIRITAHNNSVNCRSFATHAVENAIADYKLLKGNVSHASKNKIIDSLVSGANEMILWVKLQLLRLCSYQHEKDLLAALNSHAASTPEALYGEAYERIEKVGVTARETSPNAPSPGYCMRKSLCPHTSCFQLSQLHLHSIVLPSMTF